MPESLSVLDWSKPISKIIRGKSYSLGYESLRITDDNTLKLVDAPETGLLSHGLIHGSGNLTLSIHVSLASAGISSFASGMAIENYGVINPDRLSIRASITGAYNSYTSAVVNHGIMRQVVSITAEDSVDGTGIFNTGILSGLEKFGYISSIIGKAYGLNMNGTGIRNNGKILTGGLMKGTGVDGIINNGTIDFGSAAEGLNRIIGVGMYMGFSNSGAVQGSIHGDYITGHSSPWWRRGVGINNEGQILLGDGNDRITALTFNSIQSIPKLPFQYAPDLINTGTIDMGAGNDLINVSENGISGLTGKVGRIDMGSGNDGFLGFGNDQIISGGDGIDTWRLPAGTYTFSSADFPLIGSVKVSAAGASLFVNGFERIGLLGTTKTIPFPLSGTTLTL